MRRYGQAMVFAMVPMLSTRLADCVGSTTAVGCAPSRSPARQSSRGGRCVPPDAAWRRHPASVVAFFQEHRPSACAGARIAHQEGRACWERAGALVTLFATPWGPKTPSLATPQFLFASDPIAKHGDDTSDEGPSQRPYETLTALAAKLSLSIDTSHGKNHYVKMMTSALACDGAVLIAWQHEYIPLATKTGVAGISQEILTQTGTTGTFNIPTSWPTGPAGARYDLVFVFDRPSGNGPITGFTLLAQQLLAGDLP
jgi:hypothetical protein